MLFKRMLIDGAINTDDSTFQAAEIAPKKLSGPKKILLAWWLVAFLIHLAWVPNLIWFMEDPHEPPRSVIEVSTVVFPTQQPSDESEADALRSSLRIPRIELPGTAPGGSIDQLSGKWHEWNIEASDQWQTWAPRALDHAENPRAFRPHRQGNQRQSPDLRVSVSSPDTADVQLTGVSTRDDSLLRERGESLRGKRITSDDRGGRPQAGQKLRLGDGQRVTEQGADGDGGAPRSVKRGARPRQAQPLVAEQSPSVDAVQPGNLAGTDASRQATPETALSAPVRQSRLSSQVETETEAIRGGRQMRNDTGGTSNQSIGAGQGGQGRGSSGQGRASDSLMADYRRDARARIGRHWRYPQELAIQLEQGVVILDVRIRHDGRVERITIRRSSGFEAFDQYAVDAVEAANPLAPPPPEELFRSGRNHVVLSLPMRYRNPMFE